MGSGGEDLGDGRERPGACEGEEEREGDVLCEGREEGGGGGAAGFVDVDEAAVDGGWEGIWYIS